jgi:hypothetical protein
MFEQFESDEFIDLKLRKKKLKMARKRCKKQKEFYFTDIELTLVYEGEIFFDENLILETNNSEDEQRILGEMFDF